MIEIIPAGLINHRSVLVEEGPWPFIKPTVGRKLTPFFPRQTGPLHPYPVDRGVMHIKNRVEAGSRRRGHRPGCIEVGLITGRGRASTGATIGNNATDSPM